MNSSSRELLGGEPLYLARRYARGGLFVLTRRPPAPSCAAVAIGAASSPAGR